VPTAAGRPSGGLLSHGLQSQRSGSAEVQSLHLEHMTLLWIRMVRMGGHSPHLVWAALQR